MTITAPTTPPSTGPTTAYDQAVGLHREARREMFARLIAKARAKEAQSPDRPT